MYTKDKKEVVLWEDTVYDVSRFKKEHPGGVKLIDEYLGKRIDEPFEEENHSSHARKILKKLPVVGYFSENMAEKLVDDFDDKAFKNSFCCSRKYVMKKLVTKEDPIYLHKTLGLLSLMSYVYRFAYVFPTTGNLGFEGTWFDHFTVFVTIALSSSSLIFEVLK